jgi:hypothetical protein
MYAKCIKKEIKRFLSSSTEPDLRRNDKSTTCAAELPVKGETNGKLEF